jgi:hypothetical protein
MAQWINQQDRYIQWENRVNAALVKMCGLGIDDLPDMDYRSSFNAGETPRECAELVLQVIHEEGYF